MEKSSDLEKAFELYRILDEAYDEITKLGEFKDYDIDMMVENIYIMLEDLIVDTIGILKDLGASDEEIFSEK